MIFQRTAITKRRVHKIPLLFFSSGQASVSFFRKDRTSATIHKNNNIPRVITDSSIFFSTGNCCPILSMNHGISEQFKRGKTIGYLLAAVDIDTAEMVT